MQRYSVFYSHNKNVIFKTDRLSKAKSLVLRTNEHTLRRFGTGCQLAIWDNHLDFKEE